MINSKNIVHHELIGLNVNVKKFHNKSFNLKGIVIDETKNTLKIETIEENGNISEKIFPKDVSIFQFKLPNGEFVEIDGKILLIRPEDRIKKRYKKI
ncbi:ribonuclease P protein subunit [Methanobrevibacter sp. OttesenSCG-928-K11]|nr:ribonuclease P protein subunit [Methanobrevibacter sp. OttesenSCG-928-K11]MDL2270297.1 ribonuclease P protein subunit [Methanobrevibacter sp. OttesenSCG-928-I08]